MAIAAVGSKSEDKVETEAADADTSATTATPVAGEGTVTTAGIDSGLGSKDASADVTGVQVVRKDDPYFPTVEVQATITNNSEKRSDYLVTIAAESPDGATRYEETYLSVDGLEPGQSTQQTAMLFEENLPGDAIAVVKEVQRMAST